LSTTTLARTCRTERVTRMRYQEFCFSAFVLGAATASDNCRHSWNMGLRRTGPSRISCLIQTHYLSLSRLGRHTARRQRLPSGTPTGRRFDVSGMERPFQNRASSFRREQAASGPTHICHCETKRWTSLSSGTERRAQHSSAAQQKEGPDTASKIRTGDELAAFPRHCSGVLAMKEKS